MFSISYGADEHYKSSALEGAKQIIASARRLVSLYAFNSGSVVVYLAVQDSSNAGTDSGPLTIYPVQPGSFISIATHGGDRFNNGIYLKPCTDVGLTTGAGNVMWYKVDWTAAV